MNLKQTSEVYQEMPLISVIVPVYQVKDYIDECLKSLLAQTYTNLEIILVDDGSSDGSEEICDKYVTVDARIRVIHQKNQGLSGARNTGMEISQGQYVAFVDSDDVTSPDYIMILYRILKEYQADIAVCAYLQGEASCDMSGKIGGLCRENMEKRAGYISHNTDLEVALMSSEQMLRQWHGKYKKWETVVWNKLYRTNVLKGGGGSVAIQFPLSKTNEDVMTSHLIVANARRIVLTTRELYFYRTRSGSITMQNISFEKIRQNLYAQRKRMGFFRKKRYWRAYLNLLVGYVLHLGWFGCKICFMLLGTNELKDSKKGRK